ncbi:MAG: M18 family aminopeptidase [Ilumatobacteraceae bacterium]
MDSTDTADLMRLLDASPSPFHAAAEVTRRLAEAGSEPIDPERRWTAGDVSGMRHLSRAGAVIAWRLGTSTAPPDEARIVGAHTDSPCLRLKPRPDVAAHGWRQIDVEVYGGILNNSWLDRDLGIAGRIIDDDGRSHLVRSGPVARVPQLAIHLDRGVNDGLRLDPQAHLMPVWGLGERRDDIAEWLGSLAGVGRASWWDLCLFDTQPAAVIGRDDELLASARLDNLVSCWAATTALTAGAPPPAGRLHLMVLNDHEEVGSASATGAEGPLLEHVLLRIVVALGGDAADLARMLATSSCVSADNAHAIHPNYPDRHDPLHAPTVNAGPAIKVNVNQRYATSATTAAMFAAACRVAGVPWQLFSSRNNMPCGSTIGPITATRLGVDTVDVGVPQLSMHSARELCGVDDPAHLARALAAYWSDAVAGPPST